MKVFSVTAKDCKWDYLCGTGKGGQKRNKTSNCVRCTHEPSGGVGKSVESRSQIRNKQNAFVKMAESKEFQTWLHIEISRKNGDFYKIKEKVDRMMNPINIKVEYID